MKFLIDGSKPRLDARRLQWSSGIAGQLITPLTRYKRAARTYAIDNGAFSRFDEFRFKGILYRNRGWAAHCLFVAIPDVVGDHAATWANWDQFSHLADGYKKAFVAQNGYDGCPLDADALFIGGDNSFKDSEDAADAVRAALAEGMHVHVGRVNEASRYIRFRRLGAHTCDGSGVSRFDHMLPLIKEAWKNAIR